MLNFDYYAPTKVVFGKDAQMRCAGLVKECGGTRVFLLYGGGSAVKSGLIGTIEQNLRENGLVVAEYITDVSARLIVNIASLKLRKAEIEPFISEIEQYLAGEDDA